MRRSVFDIPQDVIPAKAGIHKVKLDSRLRGNDNSA